MRIPERFAIGIDIPSRGLSSDGAAVTRRKGRAARMRVGEKCISTSGGLAGDGESKETETGDHEGCRIIPFYTHNGVQGPYEC